MKPYAHRSSTRDALARCSITKRFEREQIMVGTMANDLCELSGIPVMSILRTISRSTPEADLAQHQSRYGAIVSIHAMAKASGIPASETVTEMRVWMEYLVETGLNGLRGALDLHQPIREGDSILKPLFANVDISLCQLFGTDHADEIRCRAVGMLLHLMQDSFTRGHCDRENKKLTFNKFFYYNDQKGERPHDDSLQACAYQYLDGIEDHILTTLVQKVGKCDLSIYLRVADGAAASGG